MNLDLIKQLRLQTHLGLTECKEALSEANDNFDQALEILKKKGLKKVDKLILPKEGAVYSQVKYEEGACQCSMIELNTETDFGMRSEPFQTFIKNGNLYKFLCLPVADKRQQLDYLSRQLGEQIDLRRFETRLSFFKWYCYNHPNGRLSVLLSTNECSHPEHDEKLSEALSNIAMQIAANNPMYISRSDIDEATLSMQKASFAAGLEKKPINIMEKIVEGKLNKWFSEVCLMDQSVIFIEGSRENIRQYLDKINPEIKIESMIRYELGEQI